MKDGSCAAAISCNVFYTRRCFMYTKDISLNASTYKTVFTSASGSLHVPVKNSVAVYTQFEHVKGTPAAKGEAGVSVSRIRLLNTLIDKLVSMKKDVPEQKELESADEFSIDSMIFTCQKQIKSSFTASGPATYGLAGLMPEPGAVFDISA